MRESATAKLLKNKVCREFKHRGFDIIEIKHRNAYQYYIGSKSLKVATGRDFEEKLYNKPATNKDLDHVLSQYERSIRKKRESRKQVRTYRLRYNNIEYNLKGGVFCHEGEIFAMSNYKNIKELLAKPKKPKSNVKYIGVEIEFCSNASVEVLATRLQKEDVLDYCQWIPERSLRPKRDLGEIGHELAILAPENQICRIIGKVGRVLQEIDAEVDGRRCGLHVHVDSRTRDPKVLYSNLVSCQDLFLSMCHPSRRDNEFCRKNTSKTFPEQGQEQRDNHMNNFRYNVVNAHSFFKHQTIEVRVHDGTVDPVVINNWIRFLVKIADYDKTIENSVKNVDNVKEIIHNDEHLVQYITETVELKSKVA